MVLIDTSVFVRLYRQRESALGKTVAEFAAGNDACICGPVWVEFIGGFRSSTRRLVSMDRLRAFRWLDTTVAAYELAADWFADQRAIGPMDAVIAATAAVNGASVMTVDRGFLSLRGRGLDVLYLE